MMDQILGAVVDAVRRGQQARAEKAAAAERHFRGQSDAELRDRLALAFGLARTGLHDLPKGIDNTEFSLGEHYFRALQKIRAAIEGAIDFDGEVLRAQSPAKFTDVAMPLILSRLYEIAITTTTTMEAATLIPLPQLRMTQMRSTLVEIERIAARGT